jgi:hypothetical protein
MRTGDRARARSAIASRSKLLISRCLRYDARFVVASLGQDRPGDARQLIGERSCQNVVMWPFRAPARNTHPQRRYFALA